MPDKKDEYKVSPQEVHLKFCVAERVIVRNQQPIYEKWVYSLEAFPCGKCKRTEDVKFMSMPLGVYRTCDFDGFTEKVEPVNPDTKEHMAYLAETRQITVAEAWEVLERNHATKFPPAGLPQRPRTTKRKPPKPPVEPTEDSQ
jgi:hypothetical protein